MIPSCVICRHLVNLLKSVNIFHLSWSASSCSRIDRCKWFASNTTITLLESCSFCFSNDSLISKITHIVLVTKGHAVTEKKTIYILRLNDIFVPLRHDIFILKSKNKRRPHINELTFSPLYLLLETSLHSRVAWNAEKNPKLLPSCSAECASCGSAVRSRGRSTGLRSMGVHISAGDQPREMRRVLRFKPHIWVCNRFDFMSTRLHSTEMWLNYHVKSANHASLSHQQFYLHLSLTLFPGSLYNF